MLFNRTLKKGFTLIELIIALVIIGISVSIALPNFFAAQERAKLASLKNNMRALRVVVDTYTVDWGGIPPETVTVLHNEAVAKGYWKEFKNPFTGESGFGFAVSVFNTPAMTSFNPFLVPMIAGNTSVATDSPQYDGPPPANVLFVNSNGQNVPGLVAYITGNDGDEKTRTQFFIVSSVKKKNGSIGYLTQNGKILFQTNGKDGGNDASEPTSGGSNPSPNPSSSIVPNPYPTSPSGYIPPSTYPSSPSGSVNPNPYPSSPSGYVSPTPFRQTFTSPTDLTGTYYSSGSTPPTTQQLINPAPNTQLNNFSTTTGNTSNYSFPQ